MNLFKIFLAAIFAFFTNAYKIGIFIPGISTSQIIFSQRVGDILSDAGHTVIFINMEMFKFNENVKLTSRPGSQVWNADVKSDEIDYEKLWNDYSDSAFSDESIYEMILKPEPFMQNMTFVLKQACARIVSSKEFMKQLKDAKFDVIFAHMVDFCPIGIQYAIKAPAWIWISASPLLDHMASLMGLSLPASYAAPAVADMSDMLSFYERFKSIIGHTVTPHAVKLMFADDATEIFRHFIDPKFPDLFDIAKTAPLIFVNSNELYDLPRPTLHKIINIGGIQKPSAEATELKPLSAIYKAKIKNAKNVVIFTFGSITNASRMPKTWKNAFMNAFEKFNDTQFFIRYDGNDMKTPKNVYLNKWLPQVQLLQHPKTKVFITHGGYNGIHEALIAAKPLLVIPLLGDQFKNSRIAEKHGFGIILRKSEISESNVITALETLINDEKYMKAAKNMNAMIKMQPIPPETLLIRWTEFVAQFKTLDNLRPIGASVDTVTFYNIDVYATIFVIIFMVLFIFYKFIAFVVRKILRLFFSFRKEKVE